MNTKELSVLSPCKLNLFLYVLGKRPDGFHDLQSLFCLLDYGDTMSFAVKDDGLRKITLPNTMGMRVEDNLIYKAIVLLQERAGLSASVSVTVQKRIPMGGGLGGGSSNAATTLLVLNKLCALNLSCEKLQELGAALGSDVPFFILGHNAFVQGRGEKLQSIELEDKYYLVITPSCHVSTKDVFTDPSLPEFFSPERSLDELLTTPFGNDCVSIVRKKFPKVGNVLSRLVKYGAPAMSGTGASCFCAFESLKDAEEAQKELSDLDATSFIARSCALSPVHSTLAGVLQP